MRAYFLEMSGAGTRLVLRDVPVPEEAPGQVLVRVRAAGLNRGEFIAGHGLARPGAAKPAGNEASAEVVRTGARVMGRCPGAFAEYALMDAREAIAVPARLSWEEAAAIPLTFMVVHDMLVAQGQLKAGEWLLVTGVSSGVGVAALQSEIDLEAVHAKRLRIFGVSNKLRNAAQRASTVRGFVADFLPLFASGRIRPLIDRVFPFAELPAAKAYMESDAHVGKIVINGPVIAGP